MVKVVLRPFIGYSAYDCIAGTALVIGMKMPGGVYIFLSESEAGLLRLNT